MSFKFASSTGSTAGGYIKRDISSSLIGLQAFDHSQPYVIMCWLRCDKFVAHTGFIEGGYINASPVVCIGSTGTSTSTTSAVSSSMNRDQVTISPEGDLMVGVFTNGVNGPFVIQKTGVIISLGVWVHIALARESETILKLYVNGNLAYTLNSVTVSGRTAVTGLTTWGIRFGFGICYYKSTATSASRTVGTRYLSGAIAHIKIWDQLLTVTEIKRESGQIRAIRSDGLYAYLPSLTTTGDVPTSGGDLADQSGSANSFTEVSTSIYDVNPGIPSINVILESSLRFSRRAVRAAKKLFAVTLKFGGVSNLVQQRSIKLSGVLNMSSKANRNTMRILSGLIAFTGTAGRGWLRRLTATLGLSGGINLVRTRFMLLAGSLGFNATAIRRATRRIASNLGFAGVLQNASARLINVGGLLRFNGTTRTLGGRLIKLVGSLFTSGATGRSYSKVLLGNLSFNGGPLRSFRRALSGLLTFDVDIMSLRKGVISIYRDLRFNGQAQRTIMRRLAGMLGLAGKFSRLQIKTLQGTLTLRGSSGRSILRKLGGTLIMAGLFPRNQIIKLVRTLRFNGFLNKFSDKHLIAQAIHLVGEWIAAIGLMGSWKTNHDLDGEIDE